MLEPWVRRRILIWGKTRPEISKKYRETVCTGGVFADTKQLVRIYPIPLRYLDEAKIFKKYQWIEADVQRASDRDPRPESYRIRTDDMKVGEQLSPERGTWTSRAEWVLAPSNLFESVEALQAAQRTSRRSLGLVAPREVVGVVAERVGAAERNDYWARYLEHHRQLSLGLGKEPELPRPLTPPEYHFRIEFRCDDKDCRAIHRFGLLDWEVDALYFRQRGGGRSPAMCAEAVVAKLTQVLRGRQGHAILLRKYLQPSTHLHGRRIVAPEKGEAHRVDHSRSS